MSMFHKTVLENGLRVVTAPSRSSRSLSLGVLVEAGPAHEAHGQTGIAHLCEHLLFQGTSNRNALQIARIMDSAGGRMGGFTSRDYTCYYASVLDEYHPYAIDLLGDILLNPIFPPDALEREKRAICCEIEAYGDDPERRVHQLLTAGVWQGHPLGRPVTGETGDVARLTREDLIYFVHSNYLPAKMIFTAAGSIRHEDFVAQVRDAFWRLIGSNTLTIRTRPNFRPTVVVEQTPVAQAYFAIGLEAPSYTNDRRYAVHVFNELLGAGISSRLFCRLREEEGLVYYIGSQYRAFRDAGMLMITGSTSPENLLKVLDHALDVLCRLLSWETPVEPEEMRRAKVRLKSEILLSNEDSQTQMSRLATQELYFGEPIEVQDMLAEIEAVDAPALRSLALDTLADGLDRTGLAVVAPAMPAHYSTDLLTEKMLELRQSRPPCAAQAAGTSGLPALREQGR